MRRLSVFNNISLDGYFTGADGDFSWAHAGGDDAEWNAFVAGNASGGGALLFGRVTYELMASFWPTSQAREQFPVVAERMNAMAKYVCSRTLDSAVWSNTTLMRGELLAEVRKLKHESGQDITILGSGTIVAQLAAAGLIDDYQCVVNPIALGGGRSMFQGLPARLPLQLTASRTFQNGKVLLSFVPVV